MDVLRLELHPFGIRVCVVEPGSIYTKGVEKTLGDVEGVIKTLPPESATLSPHWLVNVSAQQIPGTVVNKTAG